MRSSSRLCTASNVVPKPAQAYEPEVPVKVREWKCPALASPDLVLGALAARLDRLAEAKDVAQIGAVIGREFSHELLGAISSGPGATTPPASKRTCRAHGRAPPHTALSTPATSKPQFPPFQTRRSPIWQCRPRVRHAVKISRGRAGGATTSGALAHVRPVRPGSHRASPPQTCWLAGANPGRAMFRKPRRARAPNPLANKAPFRAESAFA